MLSADSARDLVFVPTGNAAPDYYGGERNGLDYYSAPSSPSRRDRRVVWHFQTVHHDLWDYDVGAQPVSSTFPGARKDGTRPVVVPTKMGHLFVLHRETGAPLFPVEERAVPRRDVPGRTDLADAAVPDAPRPLHPATFTPTKPSASRPGTARPVGDLGCAPEGIFTPPALQGSIQYPGMVGGLNWG